MPDPGQFRLVGYDAVADELVEPDSQGHELGDSRHAAWGRIGGDGLEHQMQTDEQKLTLLRKLAADGFQALDQGQGLIASSEGGLRDAMATIGRRAATTTYQRSPFRSRA